MRGRWISNSSDRFGIFSRLPLVEPSVGWPVDRFHGTDPPHFNEGTHLISGKGPTPFQVVPFVF